jgi:hypothetical protein
MLIYTFIYKNRTLSGILVTHYIVWPLILNHASLSVSLLKIDHEEKTFAAVPFPISLMVMLTADQARYHQQFHEQASAC